MTDLEREIETLAALREATREAREAAKDLRAEMKAAREFRREFLGTPELDARLKELTEAALAAYDGAAQEGGRDATQAVWNRFDTITISRSARIRCRYARARRPSRICCVGSSPRGTGVPAHPHQGERERP